MKSFLRAFVLFVTLLVANVALGDEVSTLAGRLASGDDFRVRVKAALDLGKTKSSRARAPLEAALDDPSPAVRAAAAAALRVLGDERSIAALERHKKDKSDAVRAQITASIAALKKKSDRKNEQPKVLVVVGDVSIAEAAPAPMKPRFERESRAKLEGLPGVMVVEATEDPDTMSRERQAPLVFVTARLQKVDSARDGAEVVYSARVQYVVHTMPGMNIVGLVSGEASARVTLQESKDVAKVAQLRQEVLVAAVDSAVRRAPPALEAAAQ